MLLQPGKVGRTNWCSHIIIYYLHFGFGHIWIFHDVGDGKEFLQSFINRIKDCCTQKWYSKGGNSSKATHYKYFKSLLDAKFNLITVASQTTSKNFG